jgi:hypothetical protein
MFDPDPDPEPMTLSMALAESYTLLPGSGCEYGVELF